jgi:hypothetical protein
MCVYVIEHGNYMHYSLSCLLGTSDCSESTLLLPIRNETEASHQQSQTWHHEQAFLVSLPHADSPPFFSAVQTQAKRFKNPSTSGMLFVCYMISVYRIKLPRSAVLVDGNATRRLKMVGRRRGPAISPFLL